MKPVPSRILRAARLGLIPVLAGLVPSAFFAFSASDPTTAVRPTVEHNRPPSRFVPQGGWEATPDSDPAPPDPFPAKQRARRLASLGVDRWHKAGFKGQGIKVAVLDSGFRGYRAALGKALPKHVTTHSFRADGDLEAKDSQHGILCAEVIHALAPEAELLLANWDTARPDEFLAAARWAKEQGARVVTCSLIMPSWSDGEGGGAVNAELAEVLGSGGHGEDLLCFASAGNTAQRHWSGAFHDDGTGLHLWGDGQTANAIKPWGTERVSVELYWQPGAAYEVSVTDENGEPAGHSLAYRGADRHCHIVQFHPEEGTKYQLRVRLTRGPGGAFHLVALGGGLACSTARGSVACPADCAAVMAVGAVNEDGRRVAYSACGPNSGRPKPDFVAPVPFPSLWRARPFTGTSAAAPQAAGLAALCWSRHPSWTAEQVTEAMRQAAKDLGPPGHDWETGYGMIAMPKEEVPQAASQAAK